MADPISVPQPMLSWFYGLVAGILTILYGVLGWSHNREVKKNDEYAKKLDTFVSEVARDYVLKAAFNAMELRVAGLASRRELIAYLREHKESQQRQHDENQKAMQEIRATSERRDTHAQEFRKEMRDNLGVLGENMAALALKVEKVSTIQKAQGAPGSS